MPVCHEREFIFIHVPKNGGTSIKHFFNFNHDEFCGPNDGININNTLHSPEHVPAFYIKNHPLIKDKFDSYFKFGFVRNPYTRVMSEYFWQKKIKRIPHYQDLNLDHFSGWLDNLSKRWTRDHHMSQTYFLYEEGKSIVDFIGKVENMEKDFKTVLEKINYSDINQQLKRENTNTRPDEVEQYLTNYNKECIYELYKEDFINFNYIK